MYSTTAKVIAYWLILGQELMELPTALPMVNGFRRNRLLPWLVYFTDV